MYKGSEQFRDYF